MAAGAKGTDGTEPRELSNTTSWTLKASVDGSVTWLVQAAKVTALHAVNCTGWPVSSSPKVPDTFVGTTVPLTEISGPRPHGKVNGTEGMPRNGTPGTTTPEICTGPCTGVNAKVRLIVRIGLKLTTAEAPEMVAPLA